MRLAVRDGLLFDSFWSSDDQSVFYGVEMLKNSLKRVPGQWFERWISITTARELTPTYGTGVSEKIISTSDAVWSGVEGVKKGYLAGFLDGGPIGLSFDLLSLSESHLGLLKELIDEHKRTREAMIGELAHLLTDTDSILAIEYRSEDFSKIRIDVFTKKLRQGSVTVYPVTDGVSDYTFEDRRISAEELESDGIEIRLSESYDGCRIKLTRCDK